MSTKARRLHWRDEMTPVLTIEVVGVHDVYRFAHHLKTGQCEFASIGYRTEAKLKRRLGRQRWASLVRRWHGEGLR